ncbi:hypothetical protein [Polaribacter atrinae]|uniref:hypothetical protein n=1 Tax=Polaribacter atrinae TaxID=1333662 RepID=UPI0030F7D0B4
MRQIEIHNIESAEPFYCLVTNEVLCDEGGASLSKATLFFYWEPDTCFEFKNKLIEDKFNEYLNLLKEEEAPFWEWDKEKIAIKLLLNNLKKENKSLVLYTVFFNVSTATNEYATVNFCIDMSYKP